MKHSEIKDSLLAVRQELDRMTFTGVQAAKSIAGMANMLDKCMTALDTKEDNDA